MVLRGILLATVVGAAGLSGCISGDGEGNADPVKEIESYISYLEYSDKPVASADKRKMAQAVLASCKELGPEELSQQQCARLLVAAMRLESSFVHTDINNAWGWPPVTGLLQNRWNSTARDSFNYGNRAKLASAGCDFLAYPLFAENQALLEAGDRSVWDQVYIDNTAAADSFMTDITCNIALGAWYYFLHSAAYKVPGSCYWAQEYCQLDGLSGELYEGLMSHAQGPSDCQNTTRDYVTRIQDNYDLLVADFGGESLDLGNLPVSQGPNKAKYCR